MKVIQVAKWGAMIALLGIVVMIALNQSPPTTQSAAPITVPEPSKRVQAPDFTLKTTEGETFQLSSLKGKSPVIVNFFSTT
ncbi:MAG: redoxin domain-containing protein [Armatimonadetes bacterium]|nr:redoxin domain-containing protein [Armatimonadota bacterium]